MKRRCYLAKGLATFSAASVAGCTGDGAGEGGQSGRDGGSNYDPDADGDGVPDNQDEFPNDSRYSVRDSDSGRISVREDHWYRWNYTPTQTLGIEYEMTVRKGPAVDVILFSNDEYRHFENDERAVYYTRASELDTTYATVDTSLPAGEYYLVVDNTEFGGASPPTDFDDSIADVEYSITLKL